MLLGFCLRFFTLSLVLKNKSLFHNCSCLINFRTKPIDFWAVGHYNNNGKNNIGGITLRSRLFFNLLAELVKRIKEFDTPPKISKESENMTFSLVNSFLIEKIGNINEFSHDTIPLDSQTIRAIIDWSEEQNNYWVYKMLISILESKIDIDVLADYFDVNMLSGESSFESLNTNVESTDIIILPNFFSPITKHEREQNDKIISIVRSTAQKFFNPINNELEKCFYISKDMLKGYTIKNVVVSMPDRISKEGYITIGVTPICNTPLNKTLSYNVTKKSDRIGNVSKFFRGWSGFGIIESTESTLNSLPSLRVSVIYIISVLRVV